MILLSVLGVKTWKPLSQTQRLDDLTAALPSSHIQALEAAFARWLLELLRYQARQCIRRQYFPVKYQPLSQKWVEHKKANGLKPGFWQASGDLALNIKVWQNADGSWNIGWPPGLLKKGTSTEYAVIGATLEKGSQKANIPARPLFTVLANQISRNIVPLFLQFCQLHYPEYRKVVLGEMSANDLTLPTLKAKTSIIRP